MPADRGVDRRPVVFVDVEASSLFADSFPVEVGYAHPRALPWGGCAIELASAPVRPESAWLSSGGWDSGAEAIHGLSREALLRDGLPAGDVCDLLDGAFGGCAVVADTGAGSVDDLWLAVLYDAAGREPAGWRVEERTSDQVIHDACRAHGLRSEIVLPPLLFRAPRPTHAAAEDALRDAWLYAMVEQLGRLRVGERDASAQRAAMRDVARAVPPECWPRIDATGRGFRRRGG